MTTISFNIGKSITSIQKTEQWTLFYSSIEEIITRVPQLHNEEIK